ncbi:unnamed protein product [Microthlaspi erraticum]|uniref:Cyclin-D1-binding protein 1-like N-terminal domain-containing protein n=1 Tax=Microthlaspi erraticum TaxID=1685480 RepID=A0A6D2JNM2_9BRAS|nr:unnamed protein product [Microthlaspi erraticum]
MESYLNAPQGFLLCCHGSTIGAGPTLSSTIHSSVKQIVDSSFRLLRGSVSLYKDHMRRGRSRQFRRFQEQFGKHVPVSRKSLEQTEIGRGITQVAVSMKDVLGR